MSSGFGIPQDPEARAYLRHVIHSIAQDEAPRLTIIKKGTNDSTGRKLGVFPASFNPPTKAHEALVKAAQRVALLDECLLLLDLKAIDKEVFGASWEDRLLMLLILFGKEAACSVGVCNRGLFLEKIDILLLVYPRDTEIHFIVGHDTMVRILDHKYYDDRDVDLRLLFSKVRFLVANRGLDDKHALQALLAREENRSFAAQVVPLTLPPALTFVSSSTARWRFAQGESVRGLVSSPVAKFCRQQGFYGRQGD
jgi:nicotinic acid mononucleotide adenylyltransferase